MALLDQVKTALRVSGTLYDADEIEPIIAACKIDLGLAGVRLIQDDDPLIARAVVLYAKANFGYTEDADRLAKAYEALKNSLALSSDYGVAP